RAPVVLHKEAPFGSLQILELAAALPKCGGPAKQKVGDRVAGDLTVEGETTGHLEGVYDVIRKPHSLAAEAQLVRPGLLGRDLAESKVASIEIADMIRANAEVARYRQT